MKNDSANPSTPFSDAALADTSARAACPSSPAPLTVARELILLLVRHGETAFNAEGRIQGHRDIPLSDVGREQAARLGRRLAASWQSDSPALPGPPTAAYTSDLRRAAETADIVLGHLPAPLHLPPIPTPLLRERGFGAWQGLTTEEIRLRRAAGETDPPGGETENEVWARMSHALARIAGEQAEADPQAAPAVVLVFGHGGSLRHLLCRALGAGPETARAFRLENTGLSIVTFAPHPGGKNAEGRIVRLNDTAHLLDPAIFTAAGAQPD